MLSLTDAVCKSENLSLAYHRFARYRGLWAPGVPMSRVSAAPLFPVLKLAEDLRTGRYRPYPPHIISIAKANGGRRDLHIYMLRDRIAQRALAQVLVSRTDRKMSPFSYGFRPGRSVSEALVQVRKIIDSGFAWVMDADIERCFDSIDRGLLLQEVERRLDDSKAPEMVSQCLGWKHLDDRIPGIPQGSVLAPWLCNTYLWQLDDHMATKGTPMVRFADDFLLMATTHNAVERVRDTCVDILSRLRLRLHPLKTRIVHASMPFPFLGQSITNTLRLTWQPATPTPEAT